MQKKTTMQRSPSYGERAPRGMSRGTESAHVTLRSFHLSDSSCTSFSFVSLAHLYEPADRPETKRTARSARAQRKTIMKIK